MIFARLTIFDTIVVKMRNSLFIPHPDIRSSIPHPDIRSSIPPRKLHSHNFVSGIYI